VAEHLWAVRRRRGSPISSSRVGGRPKATRSWSGENGRSSSSSSSTAPNAAQSHSIADIASRARDKKLLPDDVQGGTFTITNPGGYGTFHGTPVINQPQSAILGTYALVKRPWVVTDDNGNDAIAIKPIMNITLTYDHRLVDGAYAGRFLRDLRKRLESWEGDGG